MKILIPLLFLFVACTASYAQDDADVEVDTTATEYSEYADDDDVTTPAVNPGDTRSASEYMNEDRSVKKFDESEWKSIINSETFQEKPPKPEEPEKKESSEPWFTLPSVNPELMRMISFVVIFVLLAFILYYVVRNTTTSQSIRKMRAVDIAAPVENIEELDFEGLLKQALAQGDLRLAVRVHYLLLLKKLNEVGLIIWKKNKTNRDYLSELYGRDAVYEDVRKLTMAYELVWYGERSVSQDSFQRISGEFESVNKHVIKDKPVA
jgi:hypothetical protein